MRPILPILAVSVGLTMAWFLFLTDRHEVDVRVVKPHRS